MKTETSHFDLEFNILLKCTMYNRPTQNIKTDLLNATQKLQTGMVVDKMGYASSTTVQIYHRGVVLAQLISKFTEGQYLSVYPDKIRPTNLFQRPILMFNQDIKITNRKCNQSTSFT